MDSFLHKKKKKRKKKGRQLLYLSLFQCGLISFVADNNQQILKSKNVCSVVDFYIYKVLYTAI